MVSRAQIPSRPVRRLRALDAPPRPPCASTNKIQSCGVRRRSQILRACSSIAQARPSWGSKRARSGTPGLYGRSLRPPRASARIQSGGVKRRRDLLRTCFSIAPCWRSKRARSGTRGLSGPFAPPSTNFSCLLPPSKALSVSDSSSGWRDWANLGDGPAGLIAEFVLANDVADYVRFRAVCRPWRRCSVYPRSQGNLDSFLPRNWIMLDKDGPCCRRFLNLSTGECIRTDLPELAEHNLLALTPEGMLLLLHEPTLVIRLLNPLTRQLIDLPPVTALLPQDEQRAWRSGRPLGDTLWVYGVGLADASTVAICFRCPRVLVVARPGDEHWTVADDRFINSALPCAGRFYCAIGNKVMVLDTSGPDQQPPRLQLVAMERSKSFVVNPMSDSIHLVDNAGELMLVYRTLDRDTNARGGEKYKRKYAMFRVDLNAGALAPAKDLRGRAVFMSLGRTISVSAAAGAFASVAPDTLYLGFDCDEKTGMDKIDGYNVANGSNEPRDHDSCHEILLAHPCSIVDCLSHCIQGSGEHLA